MKLGVKAVIISGLLAACVTGAGAGWQWTEVDLVFNTFGIEAHPGRHMYVYDLEDDGDPDIMFGSDLYDVICYRNIGKDGQPVFVRDSIYFGSMQARVLRFVDLDGDSVEELVADTNIFRNTGTPDVPVWEQYATLTELGMDSCGAPWFADLDGDGDFDAVAVLPARNSSEGSRLTMFRNIGSPDSFAVKETTLSVFDTVFVGWTSVDAAPFCVDADSDGDLDIVFSSIILDSYSMQCHVLWNQGGWRFTYDEFATIYLTHWGGGNFCPYTGKDDLTSIYELTYNDLILYPSETIPETLWGLFNGIRLSPPSYVGYTVPAAYDAGNDGDVDLYISEYSGDWGILYPGIIMLHLNGLTNDSYNGVPYWRRGANVPNTSPYNDTPKRYLPMSVLDWNGDGESDLLYSGQHNIELHADTVAGAGVAWQNLSDSFNYFDSLTPHDPNAADIDDDGDYDLFVKTGSMYKWYRNTGTNETPAWEHAAVWIEIAGAGNTIAALVDIDDDDRIDIVFGKDDGTLVCFRNSGSATSPAWTEDASVFAGIDVGDNCTPCFVDYDSDGDLDMITGNKAGELAYFENVSSGIEPAVQQYYEYYPVAIGNSWHYDYSQYGSGKTSLGLDSYWNYGTWTRTVTATEQSGDTVIVWYQDSLIAHKKTYLTSGDSITTYDTTANECIERFVNGRFVDRDGNWLGSREMYSVHFDSLQPCSTQLYHNRNSICLKRELSEEIYVRDIGLSSYWFQFFSPFGYESYTYTLNRAIINDSTFSVKGDSLEYTAITDIFTHRVSTLRNTTLYYSINGARLPVQPSGGLFIKVIYDAAGNVEIRKVFRN